MESIIEEEENSPTRSVVVFGFEAIIALTLGTFFLCCNTIILWKTKIIGKIIEKCVDKFPILKLFGFGKSGPEAQQEEAAPRIGAENCCICFGDINREVSSTCGHIFCGRFFGFLFSFVQRKMPHWFLGKQEQKQTSVSFMQKRYKYDYHQFLNQRRPSNWHWNKKGHQRHQMVQQMLLKTPSNGMRVF